MAKLYLPPTQNSVSYTLDTQLAAGATTLTLNQSVTGVIQAPGVGWVDRVDSSGNATPATREYFTFTGVSGAQLTGLVRGLAGSSDRAHAVGAIVEFGPDVIQAQASYDVITTEHSIMGQHTSLASVQNIITKNITASTASIGIALTNSLSASNASLGRLMISTHIEASGASQTGFISGLNPVFAVRGQVSGPTTTVGGYLPLPAAGTWQSVAVCVNGLVSMASLLIDINVNNTSIFAAGCRPAMLAGGTYVSTASINTKAFKAGDLLSVDFDNTGAMFILDPNIVVSAK